MALHVALIEPRIPPNTGNVARLCAANQERLIEGEMNRAPGIPRGEAARRAVQRYQRDNR